MEPRGAACGVWALEARMLSGPAHLQQQEAPRVSSPTSYFRYLEIQNQAGWEKDGCSNYSDDTDGVNSGFMPVFLLPSAPGECNFASPSPLTASELVRSLS